MPKVMTCGHTLCFECLKRVFTSGCGNRCPFCKLTLVGNFNDMKTNFALVEAIDRPISTVEDKEDHAIDVPPIQVGDIVVRGPDWNWGTQDGGAGSRGLVIDNATANGWVRVMWNGSKENNYRWGADGCFDLAIIESRNS